MSNEALKERILDAIKIAKAEATRCERERKTAGAAARLSLAQEARYYRSLILVLETLLQP